MSERFILMRNGTDIKIKDMDNQHLINALKAFEKQSKFDADYLVILRELIERILRKDKLIL